MRRFDVPEEDRAHYSAGTIDVEYRFGFPGKEWGELMGVANRTDYDLGSHTEASGQSLTYFDQASGEKYMPYVIEPSFGLTRAMMAFLVDAYHEEEAPNAKGGTDTRTVLKLDPRLAPVKVAVLPLSRNERLSPVARELADDLRGHWNIDFDDAGAIGRRYRRQDEIGTPFCVTVDFDTLDDQAVTVRDRDTMGQERVPLEGLQRLPRGAPARRLSPQAVSRSRVHFRDRWQSATQRSQESARMPSLVECTGPESAPPWLARRAYTPAVTAAYDFRTISSSTARSTSSRFLRYRQTRPVVCGPKRDSASACPAVPSGR